MKKKCSPKSSSKAKAALQQKLMSMKFKKG